MLPGKKYTPEDVLVILRRRIWLVLVPFAIVSAATAVWARRLPDRYRSETLILVVPQRVPESYVRPTVIGGIEDRLPSITQQILSRTRLERIIRDFNLYAEQRRVGIMEDIVDRMRQDVGVQLVRGDAFTVSFAGDDPRTVMRVTDRLASLFIEENLRDREVLSEGTNQFLEAQLDDARRRLMENEKKLEDYRKRFSGQLPSQLDSNLQAMQNTQMQIQSVVDSLNRDRDRRLVLERQLADLDRGRDIATPAAATAANPDSSEDALTAGTITQQLAAARALRESWESRFKPEHPDFQRLERQIRDLEAKAKAEALNTPTAKAGAPRPLSLQELERQQRREELRVDLEQLDRQIAAGQEQQDQLRQASATYQQRVEMIPTRESELTQLMRDYTTLQTVYTELLSNNEEAKIATNLERRQVGQRFKLLDPARMAEKPFSPNRQRITGMGMLAGLAIGVGLIALLEYRDKSFTTDQEITQALTLPVLAVVPLMQADQERRFAVGRQMLLRLGLGGTVVSCLAVVVYTFVR